MTKEERKKINDVYDDCLKANSEYQALCVQQPDELINKGWIEALEFVLRFKDSEVPKGFTRVQSYFRKTIKK